MNATVDKHARIVLVIVSKEAWSIENGVLTPTLKIRRDAVEDRFGERASIEATKAAKQHELLIIWM